MSDPRTEYKLAKEAAAANALRKALRGMTDDDEAVRDTIEGETSLHDAIVAVMADIREDEILLAGATKMTEAIGSRMERFKARIARRRAAVEQAMQIGEIKSLELPDATITLKAVPAKIEIEDEAKIPSVYWKTPDPTLDRSALAAALKSKTEVPGARLGNGSITLQIRRA